jgi:hypothetical protein
MYRVPVLILIITIFLSIPSIIHAHSGLPFLRVNNKFTVQDTALDTFKPGETITFEIDKLGLNISEQLANEIVFRWQFDTNHQYSYGLKTKHLYTTPGTYKVIIDAQIPGSTTFTPFDSVKVTVTPRETKIPQLIFISIIGALALLGIIRKLWK